MSSPPPTVSIILTTYNRPDFLADTIGSVRRQTLPELELLVIDDGSSTPATAAICREHAAADKRIQYIRQQNAGVGAARNAGAECAAGEFLAFIDDDDTVHPAWLEKLVAALRENPRLAGIGCAMTKTDARGLEGRTTTQGDSGGLFIHAKTNPLTARKKPRLIGVNMVIKTAVFRAAGGFDARFRMCEDIEFSLRLAAQHDLATHPDALYFYRAHDIGNLCGHPLFWHFSCAAYIKALFERRAARSADAPLDDFMREMADILRAPAPMDFYGRRPGRALLKHLPELPAAAVRQCGKRARNAAKRLLLAKEYDALRRFLSDVDFYLRRAGYRRGKMYLTLLFWCVCHNRIGGAPAVLAACFAGAR